MRSYDLYWIAYVGAPEEARTRRFEFRGEDAEKAARECMRKAKAAGMNVRIAKVRAIRASVPAAESAGAEILTESTSLSSGIATPSPSGTASS